MLGKFAEIFNGRYMKISEKIKVLFWLTRQLKQRKYVSLSDINEEWKRCPYNSEGLPFERNTFRNHLRVIEEVFNINIEYNNKGYYIEDPAPLFERNLQTTLLSNIENIDILSRFRSLGSRIQTEDIPRGSEYLETIVCAIRSNHRLEITHQKFESEEAHTKTIEPYCLKAKKRRWYILGRDIEDTRFKTYALDRIMHLEQLKDRFKPDASVNVETYFNNSIGIVVNESLVDTVRIRTSEITAPYIRTLPLHKSQREVAPCVFEFKLAVTLEFQNELLRHGEGVEVLAPASLRKGIKERIEIMKSMYEKD